MIVEYIRYKLNKLAEDSHESLLSNFEAAYRAASSSLDASPHCLGYELSRCVEEQDRYILRIEWDSVEGPLTGFRRPQNLHRFLLRLGLTSAKSKKCNTAHSPQLLRQKASELCAESLFRMRRNVSLNPDASPAALTRRPLAAG